MTDPQIKSLLHDHGLYATRWQTAVVQILSKAQRPLSSEQIFAKLDGRCDKVTIYRTLERLHEADIVHKAYLQKRTRYFELAHRCSEHQCHPHFTCVGCGVTTCMTDIEVPLVKGLAKGYRLSRQQVRLEGLCPQCTADPQKS